MLNFIFFGTSRFSEIVLQTLKERGFLPALIITGENKFAGRGMKLTPPPAKIWAEKNNIPFLQPTDLKDKSLLKTLYDSHSTFYVLASYGRIIPKEILSIPPKGILNIHPSLLPKLRGPSPIQTTILTGERAGVSIMLMDEKVDHGPVLAKKEVEISEIPYDNELEESLAVEGALLLAEVIPRWIADKIQVEEQNHSNVTFTKKIKKEDAFIDLSASPENNLRKIHAYSVWPVAYTLLRTKKGEVRIKIKRASVVGGKLSLEKVVPEGGSEMSWQDFARGYSPLDQGLTLV